MKPVELHRWSQQFVPENALQPEPLEFLEKEHAAVLSQQFVPDGIDCTRVRQHLPRKERNRQSVEPEEFPQEITCSCKARFSYVFWVVSSSKIWS